MVVTFASRPAETTRPQSGMCSRITVGRRRIRPISRRRLRCSPQIQARVIFFGHTHRQGGWCSNREQIVPLKPDFGSSAGAVRSELPLRMGNRYVLNPGSVGQPRDGDWRAAFAGSVVVYLVPCVVQSARCTEKNSAGQTSGVPRAPPADRELIAKAIVVRAFRGTGAEASASFSPELCRVPPLPVPLSLSAPDARLGSHGTCPAHGYCKVCT